MKKLCMLLAIALCFAGVAHSQQVDQVQRTLISNVTATWCQYCGEWGLPLWDDMMGDNNNDKALPVVLHESSSSTLYSVVARDLYDEFEPINGTPEFYVNEESVNVTNLSGAIYPTLTRQRMKTLVDSFYLTSPVANVGFSFTISGNNLTVNTKSKFFKASSGEYYVNTYLVFRNVWKSQNVHNVGYVNTKHHELLKYSATSANSFGSSIVNGTIALGSEYLKSFTYALDPTWTRSDITILTLMWKKNGTAYEFVNGTRKEMDVNGIKDLAETDQTIRVYPSFSNDKVFVKIEDNSLSSAINISVFDISGRLVSENKFAKGEFNDRVVLNKLNDFGDRNGLYFIRVQTGEVRKTMRVVIN